MCLLGDSLLIGLVLVAFFLAFIGYLLRSNGCMKSCTNCDLVGFLLLVLIGVFPIAFFLSLKLLKK